LIRNPDYWGHDERYPQNKLPYADNLKFLVIPDDNEAIEAMRSGKIDILEGLSFQQAQILLKTNNEMPYFTRSRVSCGTIDPRNDVAPFNDIRVRKAMQMAIDLPTIVKDYYGGFADPHPQTLTASQMKGWVFPYEEWPNELKAEYAYNPAAAKNLLAEAGYPNGFKTNIISPASEHSGILKKIQFWFAEVGINMEIQTMDKVLFANKQTNRGYDQMVDNINSGTLGMMNEPLYHLQRFQKGFKANTPMVNIRTATEKSNKRCECACSPATLHNIPGATVSFRFYATLVERVYRSIRGTGEPQSIVIVLSGEILDR
jgi:ABC-type transport system substrate-binding protein